MCGFGDAVCYLPAAERLRSAYPHARITVMVISEVARTVLEDAGLDLDVIVFNRQGSHRGWKAILGLIRRLRRARYDLVLSGAHPDSPRVPLVALLSGARHRVGAKAERLSFLYNTRIDVPTDAHAYVRFGRLLEGAGVPPAPLASYHPHVEPSPATEHTAAALWSQLGLNEFDLVIGMATGADNNARGVWRPAMKRWLPERYADVARQLHDQHNAQVVILGGRDEYPLAEEIRHLAGPHVLNLCDAIDVRVLPWILRRCVALLTNDTGLMHLAAAVGTQVVALFGPTNPAGFAPSTSSLHVIQGHAPCSPCYPRPTCTLPVCSAMADIPSTTVTQALAALLDQREASPTERNKPPQLVCDI